MKLTLDKIPVAYRYISCLLTSLLYLTEDNDGSLIKYKLLVIIMLWTMTVILNGIHKDTGHPKFGVVLLEAAGITLLLIPTGGLESPFIWYTLNTVLFLQNYKALFSWLALGFYLMAASIISFLLFNTQNLNLIQLLWMKTEMIFIFLLIIIAIRYLSRMNKELSDRTEILKIQQEALANANTKLICANERAKKSIEHVMSLYQIMKVFSGHENNADIICRMVNYANEIIGGEISLSWTEPEHAKKDYMLEPIKSASLHYGYLVVKDIKKDENPVDAHHTELLKFLADLIAVVLERNQMEKVSNDLTILEEQNRIANEIHDNISQRIFSVVCAAHALNANLTKYDKKTIKDKLNMIEDSTKDIGRELKVFIYRLSPEKNNKKAFYDNVRNYIHEFSTLNNIKADIDLSGEAEKLDNDMKLALIRIIREASGNAVRHGECTEIKVKMSIGLKYCSLMIEDNGTGFRVEDLTKHRDRQGLGVNNMRALAQTYNGTFNITSVLGKGTKIRIAIPLNRMRKESEEKEGVTCIS